jgi:hypothetical protein
MIDRGPSSEKVLFFLTNCGSAIYGNHEDMLVDYHLNTGRYAHGIYYQNGGDVTLEQLGPRIDKWVSVIRKLPRFMILNCGSEQFLLTHAPLHNQLTLPEAVRFARYGFDTHDQSEIWKADRSIIWNREMPCKRPEYDLQIFGHNGIMKTYTCNSEDVPYAVCIDGSRQGLLGAIQLPERNVVSVKIIKQRKI